MLIIEVPVSFKIGSSGDFKVNGELRRVIWRNENTLSIAPGFLHRILSINDQDGTRRFVCTPPAPVSCRSITKAAASSSPIAMGGARIESVASPPSPHPSDRTRNIDD
jgi:hypothetical protein